MKKWLMAPLTAWMACFLWGQAAPTYAAEPPISVEVNGAKVAFSDASPFVSDQGQTMVPVRFISTTLGYHVTWDSKTNEVSIEKDGKNIVLDQEKAKVDGKVINLPTPAEIANNRTYVPLRFISETLGQPVYWEPISRTVGIGKPPATPVVQTVDVKATAYADESGNLDYFGNQLELGSVSVDPKVIPLGTKMFITGYDSNDLPKDGLYAVATDIGGAIKGNRIDIYIPASRGEVRNFGIQNVKVQILK